MYNFHVMTSEQQPARRDYYELGHFLREARCKSHGRHGSLTLSEVAKQLRVSKGFVYQVEQGKRKPRSSKLGQWATVYGVSHLDLYKCLRLIPMDLVASFRTQAISHVEPESPKSRDVDPFCQLTEHEKRELLPFIEFVRWKSSRRISSER